MTLKIKLMLIFVEITTFSYGYFHTIPYNFSAGTKTGIPDKGPVHT